MLILNRRIGEKIIINKNIEVTILGIKDHNEVRVGIQAPASVSVHREEIQQRIDKGLTPRSKP